GVGAGDKVGFFLYNGPEYIEATFGSFKVRAVPVNVNYRYTESELAYLLKNSDSSAVVVSAELAERLAAVLPGLDEVRLVVQVGGELDPSLAATEFGGEVVVYEDALRTAAPAPRIERRGDDLWFLYTGGTTGMPKGVMWPHSSLLGVGSAHFKGAKQEMPTDLPGFARTVRAIHDGGLAGRLLAAAPLMHGTSSMASWGALSAGGAVVTLESRSLDAAELLDAVARHRVTNLTIVGDAFAKPIIAELEAAEAKGAPYDLSSLTMITSSGVIWSQPVKDALLARADVVLADLLGSSEGTGFATSVAKRGRAAPTARFRLGEFSKVFTEDGVEVEPGSGERGLLAVGGPIPIGYYKDPEKTDTVFKTFGGQVWSVPGDWATVEADGTIQLLGRGSACINTAGEKVYPEEVEETLKLHPAVEDANVVGVPDEKWGNAVTAVIGLRDGASVTADELIAHCRETLAGYKCPKHVVMVDRVLRGPNGKADYRWAASIADAAPTASS
ncbi:MAG TPA: AMP-binding protein, partial [Microthrixaceae bacterium]|nr:AMP-binding protein [Microthrixaceae bacterium]